MIIVSEILALTAIKILLASVTGFIKLLDTSTENGTICRIPYIPLTKCTLFVGFHQSLSMVLRLLQDENSITGKSVLTGTINCFTTVTATCFYTPRQDSLWYRMHDILGMSRSLPRMSIVVECIVLVLLLIGNIPLMQKWMYVVWSKILTTRL